MRPRSIRKSDCPPWMRARTNWRTGLSIFSEKDSPAPGGWIPERSSDSWELLCFGSTPGYGVGRRINMPPLHGRPAQELTDSMTKPPILQFKKCEVHAKNEEFCQRFIVS